jgi:hypothetical protein
MSIKVELITVHGNTSYSIAAGCDDKVLDHETACEVKRLMGDMRAIAENIDALIRAAEEGPKMRHITGADGEVARVRVAP